ncbi:MAG: phage tail protein [Bacillota bacterium]
MSEKEVQFLTLNTRSLWEEGTLDNLEAGAEGLTLKKTTSYRFAGSYGEIEGAPACFALDRCGLIYLVDELTGRLSIFDPSVCVESKPWPLPFTGAEDIAAGAANIYIADDSRVLAVARVNFQIRWEVEVPAPVPLTLDGAENLYLLDRAGGRVLKVGRGGAVSGLIAGLVSPRAFCCGLDGLLYVLMENEVLRYTFEGVPKGAISLSGINEEFKPACLAVDRQGAVYLGGHDDEGFPCRLGTEGKPERLGYRGAVYRLALNERGDLYLLGREKKVGRKQISRLQPAENYVNEGTYFSRAFDSTMVDCRWHRFVLDAEIPENTQVAVSYSITAVPGDAAAAVMGEELINPADALITGPRGRYIRFRLRLYTKDPSRTPRLKGMKVYFPRVSYLRYLPAVYQEDGQSKDFLERFLSLAETFVAELEEKIHGVTACLDPGATPGEFLSWLSSWLAVTRYENWPAAKIRALLRNAPELYRKRGTREGIEEMITLYLSDVSETGEIIKSCGKPIIVESSHFAGIAREGTIWARLFGTNPYCFCVLLKPEQVASEQDLGAVKRIVEFEKPAHTCAGVKVLQPWFFLDWHTYLGINTGLTEQKFVAGLSILSRDTMVDEVEEGGEAEVRSRVGLDTVVT